MPNTCLRPNNEMIAKVKEWKKKQYIRVVERIEGEERMLMNLNRSICASWQRKVELEKMKHALKGEIEGMEISNSTSVSDTSTSTNVGGDDSNSTHVSDASEDEDEGRKFFDPESDAHIRTEYNDYTEFFSDDDIITRTEFKRTGVTVHYEGNKKKKVEFFSPHEQEGAVDYYETSSSKNKMVHTEFYPPHKRAGVQQGYHGNGKAKRNVPIPGFPEKCIVRNDVPKKKSDEGRRTPKRGHAAKPNETFNVKQPSPKKQKKELVKQKVVKRKDPPNFEQLGEEEQCALFLAETDIQDLGSTLQDSTIRIQKLLLEDNGTYKIIGSSITTKNARRFETGKNWAARVLKKYGFKFGTATGVSKKGISNKPIVMKPPPQGPFSVKGDAMGLLGKLQGQDGLILSMKNLLKLVYHLREELQNKSS
jgi:hypothetical protein